jgi:putative nucleotidyltransferase with HDIG domain
MRHVEEGADAHLVAAIPRWIGATYRLEGRVAAARDCFRASLAIARARRDWGDVAHALNWLGILRQDHGRLDSADRLFRSARSAARRGRARRTVAMVEQNLGISSNIRGDLRQALTHYRRALACYDRLHEPRYAAQVLNALGMLYTDLGRWRTAERSFARSARLAGEAGDLHTSVMVAVNRTELMVARGALAEARAACEEAHTLARRLGQEGPLGEVHRWLGVIRRESGALADAERALVHARSIARRRGIPLLEAETEREMAVLFRRQERNQEALTSLLASRRIYAELHAQRDLAELARRLDEIESQFLAVVRAWAESIEAKDLYTHGHCNRVASLATVLAGRLGFDGDTLEWFRMGAFLHDVGKMETPIGILNKPGALTDSEADIMRRHTVAGDHIVARLDFPWDIRPIVRSHHERWDGSGYPDGLVGGAIPVAARILCVVDTFDALTSERPYRPALSVTEAMRIMAEGTGTQFDPAVFAEFVALMHEKPALVSARASHSGDPRGSEWGWRVGLQAPDLLPPLGYVV